MSIKEMIDKAVEITKASNELRKESSYKICPDGESVLISKSIDAIAYALGVEICEEPPNVQSDFKIRRFFLYEGVEFYNYE